MLIHTDDNGVAVNAISKTADGTDVEGHLYQVLAGRVSLELYNAQTELESQHKRNRVLFDMAHTMRTILLEVSLLLDDRATTPEANRAKALEKVLFAIRYTRNLEILKDIA